MALAPPSSNQSGPRIISPSYQPPQKFKLGWDRKCLTPLSTISRNENDSIDITIHNQNNFMKNRLKTGARFLCLPVSLTPRFSEVRQPQRRPSRCRVSEVPIPLIGIEPASRTIDQIRHSPTESNRIQPPPPPRPTCIRPNPTISD